MRITYQSTQETDCAGCGKRKHTPLRRDEMGGYVCLTCIDQKLDAIEDTPNASFIEGIHYAKQRVAFALGLPPSEDDGKDIDREVAAIQNLVDEQATRTQLTIRIERLRKALAALIGAETNEDLKAMELAMRLMPGIEADKIDAINAIHALLAEAEATNPPVPTAP